jgi:hypothetical protein
MARVESVPGERVWCVTTETGTLLVRRNGRTAIVGNCIGRLRRDGMGGDPVVAYYLVAESGSDPVVMDVLGVKRRQADAIVDPDTPVIAMKVDTSDRVRRLARQVIAARR